MLNYQLLDNHKINYNPLVLFNSLFIITDKETDVKGYWKDTEGKLYIDNIRVTSFPIIHNDYFRASKRRLFDKGEKCIFFKNLYNEGVIEYPDGKQDILKTRMAWLEDKEPSLEQVKAILDQNGGLTVYKVDNGQWLLEVYK